MVTIYRTPNNDIVGVTNTKDSKKLLKYFHSENEKSEKKIYEFIFHVSGRTNHLDLRLNYDFLNIPEGKRFIVSATEYINSNNLKDLL